METKTIPTTQEVIMGQLKENTGRAICDSGDAYGRNWSRNATKTWEELTYWKEGGIKLSAEVGGENGEGGRLWMNPTISLAKWMEVNLEYCHELQMQLEAKAEETPEGVSWFEIAEDFALEHDRKARVENTYNFDNHLSQTIWYTSFEWEDSDGDEHECLLVMVHGGCDVRGGYTKPKAYKIICDDYLDFKVDGFCAYSCTWDPEGGPSDEQYPHFLENCAYEFKYESEMERNLAALSQTDKDNEETRKAMREQDAVNERNAFVLFCLEHPGEFVVWKHEPYLVTVEGDIEKIEATAYGMY